MANYRKKPVEIEAFKLGRDNVPPWFYESSRKCVIKYGKDRFRTLYAEMHTLEGVMRGNQGDYVIKGVKGEIYACKPDIFHLTYTKVEE